MEKNQKKLILFMPSMEGGGVEKNLILIANFLINHIKNIDLITFDKKFNKKFDKRINIICPNKEKGNYSKYFKYFHCLILLSKLLLIEKKVLVFAFQANVYCIIISKIFRKKIIVRSNSAPEGWNKNIFKNLIFKFCFKLSDCIIVNSNSFKNKVDKIFKVNSYCIYNPLNKIEIIQKSKIQLIKPFKKKKSLKLINVARFTDQKNHMMLLKSLNLIQNNLNFELIIMGYGPNKTKMISFIKENNLTDKIRIINFKENPYNYIKYADVFILTSNFEGLPNVLLESICLKKIIISTDCPTGPNEILKKGKFGSLVKINDTKKLSRLLLNIDKSKKNIKI